jgi:tetratricopeptide (TPR) repeat protein
MRTEADIAADALQRAQALAQAGDLAGAAELCRFVLERIPAHFYALFLLGTIESQRARFAEAEKFLAQAVRLNPRSPEALTLLGDTLSELKRHGEAIAALDRALAHQPRNPTALIYRGIACAQSGREDDALADFTRALALDPRSVFALHNRANVLIARNRLDDARRDVEALLAIAPEYGPAINNRALLLLRAGNAGAALAEIDRALHRSPGDAGLMHTRAMALAKQGRGEEALAAFDDAIAADPARAEFHLGRGNVLMEMKRNAEAQKAFEAALACDPACAQAALSCGNLAMDRNDLDDALRWCARAIGASPDYAAAFLLRGNILLHLGRGPDAFAAYDAALAAQPDYAEAHYHRGSALLLHGRFAEGWRECEHRWAVADCPFPRPVLQAAEWRGEDLAGKSLVVFAEQGLGDTIMFARFLPLAVALGARVTFLCHPHLIKLFAPLARTVDLIAISEADRHYDFQCALMSLPERLGVGADSLPACVPYLFADEAATAAWRGRIGARGLRIGIGWQGNPAGQIDKGRSIPLSCFAPLGAVAGARLISLQKNHGLDQMAGLPETMRVETLGAFDEGPDAFIDSAAILKNLDLVITSDTALAHLAGALGVPVWVALKQIPDWRWMLGRDDSPWYPSMRLFRQPARGDWDSVFAGMTAALRERAP